MGRQKIATSVALSVSHAARVFPHPCDAQDFRRQGKMAQATGAKLRGPWEGFGVRLTWAPVLVRPLLTVYL